MDINNTNPTNAQNVNAPRKQIVPTSFGDFVINDWDNGSRSFEGKIKNSLTTASEGMSDAQIAKVKQFTEYGKYDLHRGDGFPLLNIAVALLSAEYDIKVEITSKRGVQ
jgi:hypothetical protein